MREVFPNHRWRDRLHIVHNIARMEGEHISMAWKGHKYMALTSSGEARTPCGIGLGDDHFTYTTDPTTCLACIGRLFLGWRKPP